MIIYRNTADGFQNDVDNNVIVDKMLTSFKEKIGHSVSPNERRSWENSLRYMATVVRKSKIADDCGILLEYNIPNTAKRIDFVVGGHDKDFHPNFIIVELKQWDKAYETDEDMLVRTFVGGGQREVSHPSYQAYSYKQFLRDMNTAVAAGEVHPYSCAYLHNYESRVPEPLLAPQYKSVVQDTPIFFRHDVDKISKFFKGIVGEGGGKSIITSLENSKIQPSKKLIDYVDELFRGNPVFTLLDEQQVAYAKILKAALHAQERTTVIINGGPGTGKSVVAMNAFIELLKHKKNVRFVAPNEAFRDGIQEMLSRHKVESKKRLKELFSGSSVYYDAPELSFDVLIVDEAHRLKRKGTYMYKGESQTDDIIKASKVNIFFIDDFQQIRPNDEGSVDLIKQTAAKYNSEVVEVPLKAQFRCSGADGYVNWLDDVLQIQETANYAGWDEQAFEFKLMDTPQQVEEYVADKVDEGNTARVMAGFAWEWTSEGKGNPDAQVEDVVIPEYHYARPWNSRKGRSNWAYNDAKIKQIGCIHTVQGLEFDYAGVIIGDDMVYNPLTQQVEGSFANYYDTTGKQGLRDNPEKLTWYIKNVYKVLLTRGQKGCAVFVRDPALKEYLQKRLEK